MVFAKKFALFFFFLYASTAFVGAQEVVAPSDTLPTDSTTALPAIVPDSIAADTVSQKKKAVLDARVDYQSRDSIVMTGDHLVFLYGEGNVKYQTMELNAEYIRISMDSSAVYASYVKDSIGDEIGYPVFKDGGSEYESKTMNYNFKSKKGYITDVITQQGEGYVTAARTKKMSDNVMYMVDGKYTTCDDHDHPHFYVHLTKAKIRTGKNIVTGPVYLVIADVPLPLALPFGFFPFTSSYSSGILMPTYGDEMTRGFHLRDGGYYFAFSDYVDLALTGEVYTKGS
ncbi:MAG: LPS-assembly protein LptD, partial [Dysgonamonadaceae bacterium]|nr:LPS-assembly protein LptD [Dysgonamonadaceae bacterium]